MGPCREIEACVLRQSGVVWNLVRENARTDTTTFVLKWGVRASGPFELTAISPVTHPPSPSTHRPSIVDAMMKSNHPYCSRTLPVCMVQSTTDRWGRIVPLESNPNQGQIQTPARRLDVAFALHTTLPELRLYALLMGTKAGERLVQWVYGAYFSPDRTGFKLILQSQPQSLSDFLESKEGLGTSLRQRIQCKPFAVSTALCTTCVLTVPCMLFVFH